MVRAVQLRFAALVSAPDSIPGPCEIIILVPLGQDLGNNKLDLDIN